MCMREEGRGGGGLNKLMGQRKILYEGLISTSNCLELEELVRS